MAAIHDSNSFMTKAHPTENWTPAPTVLAMSESKSNGTEKLAANHVSIPVQ